MNNNDKLDMESIGSYLGIDWELIWSGVEWSGPAIRPGLDNRHLIIEGHRGFIEKITNLFYMSCTACFILSVIEVLEDD